MLKLFIIILGKTLAITPRFILACISHTAGTFLYLPPTRRKRIILSNLHHAFPKQTEKWRRKVAHSSCIRTIEMALFMLAFPFLSKKRIHKTISLSDSFHEFAKSRAESSIGDLLLIPHFSLTETLTVYPLHYDVSSEKIAVVYRPLNNPSLDKWIKKSRGRYGVVLLSRKKGFFEAINILKNNGIVGILFDQNGGSPGTLTTFFDRIASTTELPDILAKKTSPRVSVMYSERLGFWKAKIHVERLPSPSESLPIAISANAWLEKKLKENIHYCTDWLWFHHRWRTQDDYHSRFRIKGKRSLLPESLAHAGHEKILRKTRIWLRMPNWLGDIIMALPLIKALRESRPDAQITLLAQKAYVPLLEKFNVADKIIPLPSKGISYYFSFRKFKLDYPDTHFLFTNSERLDNEYLIMREPHTFKIKST